MNNHRIKSLNAQNEKINIGIKFNQLHIGHH